MPIPPLLLSEMEEVGAPTLPGLLRLRVVDSHRLFGECLAAALRDDAGFAKIEVMDADQKALAGLAEGGPVDVMLLGCGGNGQVQELLREARRRWPAAKILV